MKKEGYYSSGEFARMAHVTLRTIRYYDKQNILKPSYVSDAGARFYTDEDLARLQQILLLKFLGFSLDDIRICGLPGACRTVKMAGPSIGTYRIWRFSVSAVFHIRR